MAYLVDTNVLVRLANTADSQYSATASAIVELHRRGETLQLTPQVLIEFRNVATRPKAQNGLGFSLAETEAEAAGFEAKFPVLPESPAIFSIWKSIVASLGIIGKRVHDARLVAVCHVASVTHILTHNVPHFAQMSKLSPGIVVVDPGSVTSSSSLGGP